MYNNSQQFGGQEYLMEMGGIISEYVRAAGCFAQEQAYLMLPEKHYSTIDKALKGMIVQRNLFLKGERYYVANPKANPDYTMINCLWVLLDMKDKELPNTKGFWLSSARKPVYLRYVKNNVIYDIVPVNRGENSIIAALDSEYTKDIEESQDIMHKYVIVAPYERVLETYKKMEAPHMYAVVRELSYEEMDLETKKVCNVTYYAD